MNQFYFKVETFGRGFIEITNDLNQYLAPLSFESGLINIFLQHTSASLTITENADPTVLEDLETIIRRLAPDGDAEYRHDYEGADDMAAHVRSVLTTNELTLPIKNGRLELGTWQGVFLWEHRFRPQSRSIIVTVMS
jgi:secondary thiamine-phosphate synthase enzyme